MSKQADLISDIKKSYDQLRIKKGDILYITGNVSQLARTKIKKKELLDIFLDTSLDHLGSGGTIFSPSASMNLCNTNIPFDITNTPSHSMGALAEHIRGSKDAVRSFHPFWSISGIGPQANILKNVSRHAYGLGSPWTYFLDLDVMQVNVGLHPSRAVTLIHHLEVAAGVPYRYSKEFLHPVVSDKKINVEPFYMSVMYLNSDIKKRIALNEHFFQELDSLDMLNHSKQSNGLDMWSFSMRDFKKVATQYFIKDIYNYLEQAPKIRPYQK
tara:strand:- start:117 stop:926 length:810 start_codon:yes stop_codon:yes gene_type:complete